MSTKTHLIERYILAGDEWVSFIACNSKSKNYRARYYWFTRSNNKCMDCVNSKVATLMKNKQEVIK